MVAAAESAEALLQEAEQTSDQASKIVIQVAEAAKKALTVSHDAIRQAQHALAAAKIALESEELLRRKERNERLSDSASTNDEVFLASPRNEGKIANIEEVEKFQVMKEKKKDVEAIGKADVFKEEQKKDFISMKKDIPYCPLCPNKKLINAKVSQLHNSGAMHQKNLRNKVLVNLGNVLKATPEVVVNKFTVMVPERAHVKKEGKMKDITATVKTLASTTKVCPSKKLINPQVEELHNSGETHQKKKFPYFCPVCPLKKLTSHDVVKNHIRGKPHQKGLMNNKER